MQQHLYVTDIDESIASHSKVISTFLSDGGEMGVLVRAKDWSTTPLGPIENWPHSLRTIVNLMLNSPYPMQIWWGETLTYFYNDAYTPILGVKHPAALGQSAREVWAEIWPDMAPRIDKVMKQNKATFDETMFMVLKRHGYAEETYYTFSFSPILNDQGDVGGVFNACNEETQRIVCERQLALLRELAAKTANAHTVDEACTISANSVQIDAQDLPFVMIYLLAPEGKRLHLTGFSGINNDHPACSDSLELDLETIWPVQEVLAKGQLRLMEPLSSIFESLPMGPWDCSPHQAVIMPTLQPGQTGQTALIIAGLNPYRPFDDDYQRFLELVNAQIASNIANAKAYEEEKERTEALVEIDRAKTLFFSNISHEFRTPLTLMLGPIEDALHDPNTVPENRIRMEVAYRNALRLLKLVNTLLDFSRIEAGRVQASYRPADLAVLTAELASMFRSATEKAGLKLVVDCSPLPEPVYVDTDMWEKIILNLLSNAFKHTFCGEIGVHLHWNGDHVQLIVRDSGVGIPAEQASKLFERFYRVPNARSRTHEGSGIGLALVYELVKLHGGHITVDSVVDQGTTFTVSIPTGKNHLPADRIAAESTLASTALGAQSFVQEALRWLPDDGKMAEAEVEESSSQTWMGNGRTRVLLADDNADMRDYVYRLLTPYYDVEMVPDGEAALLAAGRRMPDLILSDVMMPKMDGLELLKALRNDESFRTIPVILLSARAGEEARIEGLQAGADDYLTKPFSSKDLRARVKSNLNLARTRHEALIQKLEQQVKERTEQLETANKALQWNETRSRLLIETVKDYAIFRLGTNGIIQTWNKGAERINGYIANEIIGRHFSILYPEEAIQQCYPDYELKKAAEQGRFEDEGWRIKKDGSRFWANVVITALQDETGELIGFSKITRDLTERKHAEEDLRASEQRYRELAETLQRQSAQLEAVNQELETFSYSISHDLRAPLRAIDGFSQAVLDIYKDQLDEEGQGYLNRVRAGSRQMAHLIDDILQLSRLTQGQLNLEDNLSLSTMVQEIADALHWQEPQRQVAFDIEEGIVVRGDGRLLQATLQNLIGNAWKYTSKHPTAHIQFGKIQRGSTPAYYIKDDGAGFNMKYADKLFGAFQRLHDAEEFPGTGVGLATVARIIHRHGGEIWAEAEEEKGAAFYFTLQPISAN